LRRSGRDDQRTVTKRNSYSPYGEIYGATVIDGTGYTGHVMDQATGLTYMQQRYYDPAIGRFLSTDPAAAGFNLYNYANNNPYRFTDPDGRVAKGGGSNMGPQNWNANGDFSMSVSFDSPVGNDYTQSERHFLDVHMGGVASGHALGNGNWNVSKATPLEKLYIAAFVAASFGINMNGMGLKYTGDHNAGERVGKNGIVEIGGNTFATRSYLGAVLGHEVEGHFAQPNHGFAGTNSGGWRSEARAYHYNINNFQRFGNTSSERTFFRTQYNMYKGYEEYAGE
jgi:RHS repeat-associated protein